MIITCGVSRSTDIVPKSRTCPPWSTFERAIELDPAFARAYAGLAMAHSRDAIDGWTCDPVTVPGARCRAGGQGRRMDPSLPQVHFVTGQVDLFRRRHVQAIEAAQRAIRIDPNYADAFALHAWTLNYAGRPGEALTALEKAMRLNPRPPASYLEILGEIRFVQGRYGESASTFQRVLDVNPDYTRARMWLVAALAHAGSDGRGRVGGDRAAGRRARILPSAGWSLPFPSKIPAHSTPSWTD